MGKTERFWQIWYDMTRRCDIESRDKSKRYHARGISYQEDWKFYENFKKDMSLNYSENMTLDRINPSGDYTKENCRWIPMQEQSKNKGRYKNNKIGISNIFEIKNKGIPTLCCKITVNSKSYVKRLSLSKHEKAVAIALLLQWRNLMYEKLGFSEYHGN